MYMTFKRFSAWGLFACLPLVVAGCGGGGGDGGIGPTTTISGIAAKGPISGALVEVFQLKLNGSQGELLGSGTTANDGNYAVKIPVAKATPPLLIKVTGQTGAQYTSEATNLPVEFGAGESFYAAVDKLSAGQVIAVSPLSDAGYKKLQQILTANLLLVADARTVAASNTYIASLFNLTDLLADPAVAANLSNLAALTVIDQMVVDSNTGNTLAVVNVIEQAVTDVTAPAYQTYLTALITAADKILAAEPPSSALTLAIQSLVTTAKNPPPNPDFSDTTPPTAPTELTIKVSTLSTNSAAAALSWKAATDNNAVSGYDIYRDGNRITTVKTPGYTDSTLIPGSTYTYFIQAFDGAGNLSAASNSVSVTPVPVNLNVTVNGQLSTGILDLPAINDLTPPSAPTNLAATSAAITASTSSVTLTWTASTDNRGVTGYDVFRDGIKRGTVPTTGFIDSAVTSGLTYVYHLVAIDAAGNRSPASSTVSVAPPVATLSVTVNGQVSSSIVGVSNPN